MTILARIWLWLSIIFGIGMLSHAWYLVWFQTARFQEKAIKNYEGLPNWFPFREWNLRWYRTNTSIWFLRIFLSIVLLVILVIGIVLPILFLLGIIK